MDNRTEQCQGIGSVGDVWKATEEWLASLSKGEYAVGLVVGLYENGKHDKDAMQALYAICCSVLNTRYHETGRLFRVDDRGRPDFAFTSDDQSKRLISRMLV